MAQLSTKVELYAKANGVNSIDFLSDVKLQNDGGGDYIKEWNLDIAKPTDEQLATYESSGNDEEALNVILRNRKNEYPAIGDQLDYIYHNGVTKWKTDMITPVKEKYPKS
tara:strand:- start:146 stop:475 length:330 start_codon:yes stop_codon:yes gene_type:complete